MKNETRDDTGADQWSLVASQSHYFSFRKKASLVKKKNKNEEKLTPDEAGRIEVASLQGKMMLRIEWHQMWSISCHVVD